MRRTLSILAALGLTLALAGPAMAATTSSSTTATATVDASISLSGVPATLNLGHNVGGTTLTAPTFTMIIVASGPYSMTVTAADFTGPGTIAAIGHLGFVTADHEQQLYTGTGMVLNAASTSMTEIVSLAVPGNAKNGVYSSVITFEATTD